MSISRSKKAFRIAPAIAFHTCNAIRKSLSRWYTLHRRDLPWRCTSDPYRIWVSEVMLQQTQVRTASPYYIRFMEQFPDLSSLARADLQTVLKLWAGLGYYGRARNLHKAAGIVMNQMDGQVPQTWQALRRLPGIGDYIAAALLSIAFGRAFAVVDGNVKRVLARLFRVDAPVNQPSSHAVFQSLAGQLLDHGNPGLHNQAMMELGALICMPRGPDCGHCPVSRFCQALQEGMVQAYPQRDQRRPLPTRRMVAGVVLKKGKVLVVRRPVQGLLGGLWEFPGGSLEPGGDPVRICHEQLQASVNLQTTVCRHVDTVAHAYTHFKLQMEVYMCRWQSGRVRLNGYVQFKWLSPAQVGDLPLHGVTHKTLALLKTMPAFAMDRAANPGESTGVLEPRP